VPQIVVENLRKAFQVAERKPGLLGALRGVARRRYRTVHALDDRSTRLRFTGAGFAACSCS
jgi:ABC-2 type transport system ATP-binding protein